MPSESGHVERAPGPRNLRDNVNTNVIDVAGRAFAICEAGSYPGELGPTLDGQVYDSFGGTLKSSYSAHPHRDPLTGEMHAICYQSEQSGQIRHVVVDASARVVREETIQVQGLPMVHDCALTENFIIILDLPVTFSIKPVLAGYDLPFRWNPNHAARFGLLPRTGKSSDIIWCPVEPAFLFHAANAYKTTSGQVHLDLCVYEKMFDTLAPGPDGQSKGLERWIVDPKTGTVKVLVGFVIDMNTSTTEFVIIDAENFTGEPVARVHIPHRVPAGFHGNWLGGLANEIRNTGGFPAVSRHLPLR